MFNVCSGCGKYSDDKEIVTVDGMETDATTSGATTSGDAFAICRSCNYRHRFKLLPLMIITGASGTGKTTVALQLPSIVSNCVCMESDILWQDVFNKPEEDYKTYRNLWLRVAKNINQNCRPVVLIGSSTPGQFEQCVESRYFSKIEYLALICNEAELVKRLKARPSWRKSGSEEVLTGMIKFNQWLTKNADRRDPPMALLDTSSLSVAETVVQTVTWIQSMLG